VRESYTSLPCCLLSRVWVEEAIGTASPRVDFAVSPPSPVRSPAVHAIFFLLSTQAALSSPQPFSHVKDPCRAGEDFPLPVAAPPHSHPVTVNLLGGCLVLRGCSSHPGCATSLCEPTLGSMPVQPPSVPLTRRMWPHHALWLRHCVLALRPSQPHREAMWAVDGIRPSVV
jgi:hypothetical protein